MIISPKLLCLGAAFALAAGPASAVRPAASPGSAGLDAMLANARDDLEASTQQLAKLREEIDLERLPLAKKVDSLEKTLVDVRKEYEGVARVLDTRNLDISNLKTEIKVREDETFYVSNLLDEFVRGFESKLHIAELPQLKEKIDVAKAVPQDTKLSIAEKFTAQMPPLRASLTRAKEVLGGTRFPGTALDEQGTVQKGTFTLLGPFALFGAADGSAAGVAVAETGRLQAVIKPLGEKFDAGIASILESGKGFFPLDPTNGNALKELLHKTSLIDTYVHGGPIMHPLLLVSIVAFGVVIERLIFLVRENARRNHNLVIDMLTAVEKGELEKAVKIGRTTKDYVAKTLLYALEHREKSIGSALMLAAGKELNRLSRGLPVLDTCITLAPLLGLLGTVTGMMHSFASMGSDLGAPSAITGGISEALIATAFGLVIAIVGVIPFNYLNARIDDARHQIEAAATRMELLLKPVGGGDTSDGGGFKLAAPAAASGGGGH